MPRPRNPDPSYCLHRPSGLAFVRLGGNQFWLGKFGTPESRGKYQVFKGEWVKQGRPIYTASGAVATGMRPGEARVMRTGDIDRTATPWVYRPRYHKTEHRGDDHRRVIVPGPRAQEILSPLLKLDPAAYLFRPADAVAWVNEKRKAARKTPMTPSQAARAERAAERAGSKRWKPHYTKDALNQAVRRACERAGLDVNRFRPNQLRHLVATRVRREYGLEAAQAVLGHQHANITEVYAEKNLQAAKDVMGNIG